MPPPTKRKRYEGCDGFCKYWRREWDNQGFTDPCILDMWLHKCKRANPQPTCRKCLIAYIKEMSWVESQSLRETLIREYQWLWNAKLWRTAYRVRRKRGAYSPLVSVWVLGIQDLQRHILTCIAGGFSVSDCPLHERRPLSATAFLIQHRDDYLTRMPGIFSPKSTPIFEERPNGNQNLFLTHVTNQVFDDVIV